MNIYVGNLSYRTTEAELKEVFAQFGEVRRAKIVKDRETDRSKGFGFVEMDDANEGQKAIDALNEKELGGRTLRVNEARPRD
ncbi:RNA recognition motif domain-containing protein [Campylobacter concisus]|uniref:RNA recognition motif domain-containing protein n=1 Tax=Campylobacter concisus TaxID=199 RepID=UPI000D309189|nr:RNA-binding protein [Campylobacter concisus]